MIGQKHLLSNIDDMMSNKSFPRFSILVGPNGSGRHIIGEYIAKCLHATPVWCGCDASSVRDVVSMSYKVTDTIVYIIPDADKMSQAAKAALLKVTEEPPNTAYFIITLLDINNTLSTLRSRGSIFYMDPYSVDDIDCYCTRTYAVTEEDRAIIDDLCATPGEVDSIIKMGTFDFFEYVKKVVDNIAEVSGSNSFKIADMICLKESDTGKYDLNLFWKAFMSICLSRLRSDPQKYADGISITSKYLQQLRITGINKSNTFDMWILAIRKSWM